MRFNDYVDSFKGAWGLIAGILAVGPFALWSVDFLPPWPDYWPAAQVVLAVLSTIFGILIAYLLPSGALFARLGALTALIAAGILFGVYFYFVSRYVVVIEQGLAGDTVARAFVVGDELLRGVEDNLTPSALIRLYGSVEAVWTIASLTATRMKLILSLNSAFFLANLGLGLLAKRNVTA